MLHVYDLETGRTRRGPQQRWALFIDYKVPLIHLFDEQVSERFWRDTGEYRHA